MIQGRYAQICVQVKLASPVKTSITIGTYKQPLVYSGEKILCKTCMCLGHTSALCSENIDTPPLEALTSQPLQPIKVDPKEEWQTITFPRKKIDKQIATANSTAVRRIPW